MLGDVREVAGIAFGLKDDRDGALRGARIGTRCRRSAVKLQNEAEVAAGSLLAS
ncbi:hypothetical protein D3C72_748800 [compost metagenome]